MIQKQFILPWRPFRHKQKTQKAAMGGRAEKSASACERAELCGHNDVCSAKKNENMFY